MSQRDILKVLEDVKAGGISPEDAMLKLKLQPFEDLGYAKPGETVFRFVDEEAP